MKRVEMYIKVYGDGEEEITPNITKSVNPEYVVTFTTEKSNEWWCDTACEILRKEIGEFELMDYATNSVVTIA